MSSNERTAQRMHTGFHGRKPAMTKVEWPGPPRALSELGPMHAAEYLVPDARTKEGWQNYRHPFNLPIEKRPVLARDDKGNMVILNQQHIQVTDQGITDKPNGRTNAGPAFGTPKPNPISGMEVIPLDTLMAPLESRFTPSTSTMRRRDRYEEVVSQALGAGVTGFGAEHLLLPGSSRYWAGVLQISGGLLVGGVLITVAGAYKIGRAVATGGVLVGILNIAQGYREDRYVNRMDAVAMPTVPGA